MKCQNCGGVEWRYENTETICKKCATVIENNNIGTDQFVRITWLDIQPTRISPKMTDASGNVIPSATKKMFTRLRRQDSRMKNTRTEKKIHECLQTLDSRIFGEHTYVTYESQKVLKYIDKCQKLKSLKKEKTETKVQVLYFLICKIDSKKPVKLREIILDSPTKKHKVIERKIKNEFPELNKNTSRSTKHLKSILNLISFPSPITQGKFEKEIDRLFIKIKKVPDFTGRNPDGILAACLYYVHKKNKNLKRLNQKEICEYCHVPKSIVAQNLKDFKEMKLLD